MRLTNACGSRAPIRDFAVVALLAALLSSCAPSEKETAFLAKRALLQRQNQGTRELIAEAEQGSLVPSDEFLIGIDEKVVGDLLRAGLPLERPLGKRMIIRLERAAVELRDKFGIITVDGSVYRPSTPQRRIAVRVHGGLGSVQIDPATGLLHIRIAIDDIEILQAGILESVLGKGGKKLLAAKAREPLQDALPDIEVPVGLARKIQVPSIEEGPVALDSLTIPLDLSVKRVIAAGQKLWVTLNAEVGAIEGAESGVGVTVKKGRRAGSGR
jgi:hypothetical protein